MPSTIFTAITLDRFLEPSNSGTPKSSTRPPNSKLGRRHSSTETIRKNLPHLSPALYATPEVTPVPDSPSSGAFPPSPYIVNHKRRGPRLLKSVSQNDIPLNQRATEGGTTTDENGRDSNSEVVGSTQDLRPPAIVTACSPNKEEPGRNGFHDDDIGNSSLDDRLVRTEDLPKSVTFNLERDERECEGEDFYDPQDVPEVIALPIRGGSIPYLEWIKSSTRE
ncbi:uncharacterized protein LOC122076307 [Macadamia integrifolia]|uniref:uncharacterized protein LOC122076307 n=1 Tax=Macadamia integrifolia TaxID=60698 RepID=UPI001C4EA6C6|nr:uncharacterized protein LOC122076307 [Macadamia integrifolia]